MNTSASASAWPEESSVPGADTAAGKTASRPPKAGGADVSEYGGAYGADQQEPGEDAGDGEYEPL
jgi:hypothetical protein